MVNIEPEDWNELINDPDVDVIDVRNDYSAMGTFAGAVNPETQTFGQWADFVEKRWDRKERKSGNVCTGGIRCESIGPPRAKWIRGSVSSPGRYSNYLERIPLKSQWEGECFVFDHRVSVVHG